MLEWSSEAFDQKEKVIAGGARPETERYNKHINTCASLHLVPSTQVEALFQTLFTATMLSR